MINRITQPILKGLGPETNIEPQIATLNKERACKDNSSTRDMNIDLDDDDPFAKSLPIPSQTTTRNRENSIDLVAVQELREDVKVNSLIEEQNDLTNDTGDARCTTPIRSLEQRENTPKQRPADPGDRRHFDKWRQAVWQTLDDYGWSVDFYENTQLKMLFDRISEETGD